MEQIPLRILYVDDRDDSRAAETLLTSSGVAYGALPHNPYHFWNPWNRPDEAPVLVAAEGRFKGLTEIQKYLELYTVDQR